MRLVSQKFFSDAKVAEECVDYRQGRKNFVPRSRRRFSGLYPAWSNEGVAFQLTLHPTDCQGSIVLGFACGHIKRIFNVEAAIVELIGVMPSVRGRVLGVKMQESILKITGLPLAAAHTQTPMGRDLWFRMLKHARQMVLHLVDAGTTYRLTGPDDLLKLPFDPFDGRDATFMLDKNDIAKVGGLKLMATADDKVRLS